MCNRQSIRILEILLGIFCRDKSLFQTCTFLSILFDSIRNLLSIFVSSFIPSWLLYVLVQNSRPVLSIFRPTIFWSHISHVMLALLVVSHQLCFHSYYTWSPFHSIPFHSFPFLLFLPLPSVQEKQSSRFSWTRVTGSYTCTVYFWRRSSFLFWRHALSSSGF